MPKFDYVTITGCDDNVDIKFMKLLAERFPFVEFGILTSSGKQCNRYPTLAWIGKLLSYNLPLSLHVCGRQARDLCQEGLFMDVPSAFRRVQLNISPYYPLITDKFYKKLGTIKNIEFILQMSEPEFAVAQRCLDLGVDVSILYDVSGGRGLVPSKWLDMPGFRFGNAGGFNPGNVEAQVKNLPENTKWIDVESGVRNIKDHLDNEKVINFLNIAKEWAVS